MIDFHIFDNFLTWLVRAICYKVTYSKNNFEVISHVWYTYCKSYSCVKTEFNGFWKINLFGVDWYAAGVWFDNCKKSWKMGSGPRSPFGLEDKTPWAFKFGGFTESPHPHKQETRGLDTIQATSFFSLVATSLLSRNFLGKGWFVKILKSGKVQINHRLLEQLSLL